MGELKASPGPNAVHLCIDMQRLFAPDGPWPTPWMARVTPVVAAIVEHAPARTVFTRFITPHSVTDAIGMWRQFYRKWGAVTRENIDPALLDLIPPLQRHVPPAAVFDRMVYSAFADGRLHTQLIEKNIDTLIVTGSETDVCVLASVLAAVDRGYRVIVVADAICSSSDETHDALLGLYSKRFDVQIEVTQAAEVLDSWRP
jgi:nicotinamidase-related amidase